jgi:3,4-dihydroxy 2-butanone 4-phosphate synthase/GTP cyclohydrolase II
MREIDREGAGIVVVISKPMPGLLTRAITARARGESSDFEELRDYGIGAQILTDLGVQDMVLLTNSHHTMVGLAGYGLNVVGERAIDPGAA